MMESRIERFDALYRENRAFDATQDDRTKRFRSIEPESATLLGVLVRACKARCLLEIGTSNGYSTLWLADAAEDTGGHVLTLEVDAGRHRQALQNLTAQGLAARVEARCMDALDFLQSNQEGFDWILLDAERPAYVSYWPYLRRALAASGAMLVVDNVLSRGEEVRDFVALVEADEEFATTTLLVGAGLLLVVRR